MISTWVFTHVSADECVEVDAETFDEACYILFSGSHGLNAEDWELTDSY